MSGFKEERIDGCFSRATYSWKGGAYDLTAHYSLLMRRNDRAESPMRLCTTSVLKYTPEYLSFQRFLRVTTQIFVFLEISNGLAHTDVYRHMLECRFTHFAPYVVIC